jgi:hypothetical protein
LHSNGKGDLPDFKCAACRIRLRSPGGDGAGPLCRLDPVGELSELVGFRSIDVGPAEFEPLARPVSDLTKRRETRTERADAERWLDDAGSFDSKAVAAVLERLPPRSDA